MLVDAIDKKKITINCFSYYSLVKIENTALRLYLTNKKRKNTNELTQK